MTGPLRPYAPTPTLNGPAIKRRTFFMASPINKTKATVFDLTRLFPRL